jgi:hypothetical protein
MKLINKFIISCMYYSFFSCSGHHQSVPVNKHRNIIDSLYNVLHVDTNDYNSIRQECSQINEDSSYDIMDFDDNGWTAEGGEIYIYKKGFEIRKVIEKYYGETGVTINEYYFQGNKLILFYSVDSSYNQRENSSGKMLPKKLWDRMYFSNNGLLTRETNRDLKDTMDGSNNDYPSVNEILDRVHVFDSLEKTDKR